MLSNTTIGKPNRGSFHEPLSPINFLDYLLKANRIRIIETFLKSLKQ